MSSNPHEIFASKKRESAVDYVIRQIQSQLLQGNLKPGDKLPSEEELSGYLGVSRGSVRNAMKVFSACGIVRIKAGDGTYVCTSLNANCLNPIIFSLLILNPDRKALAQFREKIECDILELIMGRPEEIDNVVRALEQNMQTLRLLQERAVTAAEFVENDIEFHQILSAACGNIVFETVYNNILEYFLPSIQQTHLHQSEGAVSRMTHEDILDAIRHRDIALAQKAIHDSVEHWHNLSQADASPGGSPAVPSPK